MENNFRTMTYKELKGLNNNAHYPVLKEQEVNELLNHKNVSGFSKRLDTDFQGYYKIKIAFNGYKQNLEIIVFMENENE